MNIKRGIRQALLAVIVGTATLGVFTPIKQTQAQTVEAPIFACGMLNNVPITLFQSDRGKFVMIRWVSQFFSGSGYDPQTRCKLVSERFQTYLNLGALKYLTTGTLNRHPVVCVTDTLGGDCDRNLPYNGLLFTLKPTNNPGDTLKQLLSIRDRKTYFPLNESASSPVSTTLQGRVYIDVDEYLSDLSLTHSDFPPNHQSEQPLF